MHCTPVCLISCNVQELYTINPQFWKALFSRNFEKNKKTQPSLQPIQKVAENLNIKVNTSEKNLCEWSLNVISLITICVKREIREWQFTPFFVILSEQLSISSWSHVKLLKLRELGVNGNSWHRTDVKCDSMKCWKLLLSLNFLSTWIHWPIACQYSAT